MKQIGQGAEAIIYETDDRIIKKRVAKGYRLPEIDFELRKARTAREARILKKAGIPVPKILNIDKKDMIIEMEKIEGVKLSDHLEKLDYCEISSVVGKQIAMLHRKNIIHGDLTTSNMIYSEGVVYFIDFGLSFTSTKAEDKAVDLHLLKQALDSRHNTICEDCLEAVKKAYADTEVLARLEVVEKRGRHKNK